MNSDNIAHSKGISNILQIELFLRLTIREMSAEFLYGHIVILNVEILK